MARKKKEPPKIWVKRPKIGEKYWFYFAGSWEYGTLVAESESLTKHYGEPWYTVEKMTRNARGEQGRNMRYPVAIWNLRKQERDTEKK